MISKFIEAYKELGAFGPLLAFAVIGPGVGAFVLVFTSPHWFETVREMGSLALPWFIPLGILLVSLSLVPTHAVSFLSGLLFGALLGPGLALIIVVISALVSYLICTRLMGDNAVKYIEQRPKAEAVHKALLHSSGFRSFMIITLVRLTPVTPFAGTNVMLSATRVKKREFIIGSAVGLAPRVILVALAGVGVSELDFSQAKSQLGLIVGIIATVVGIIVVGKISKKALDNVVQESLEV